MKILKTYDFVSERIELQPITNGELNRAQEDYNERRKNPFDLTEKDLIGQIEGFPMGVVVKMLEETKLQEHEPDVTLFQKHKTAGDTKEGFVWSYSSYDGPMDKDNFWRRIIENREFDLFFDYYPDYKIYNLY